MLIWEYYHIVGCFSREKFCRLTTICRKFPFKILTQCIKVACTSVRDRVKYQKTPSFSTMVHGWCVKNCKSRSNCDKGLSFFSTSTVIQHQAEKNKGAMH